MCDNLALSWQNLSLYVTTKNRNFIGKKKIERIKLLNNVSGMLKSGTLSAIMGPSGAGKTTLLGAVTQRCTGFIQGEIYLNGHPVEKELMIKMCGFVPQHDLAFQSLSVKEHLYFMAQLKMDRRVSVVQQNRIISSLLQDLGLSSCYFTQLSDLSGGERRRVSLAVQLLTDPPILICDEPTTGLDSFTASNVISLLRTLSSRGKAVLCSVHQPASGIFEMFDTVSLLVPGGRLAFFGKVNDAKKYFSELDLICPAAYNTAEFVIKQLNLYPDRLCEKFKTSSHYFNLNDDIESVKRAGQNYQLVYGMDEKFLKFYSVQSATQRMQLKLLLWRNIIDLSRQTKRILLRFVLYICTGCVISFPFIGTKINQEGIQNVQGMNYCLISEIAFSQAFGVMYTFPEEIPILLREIGNGVYRPAPYYLSKIVIVIVKSMLETLLFCFVIYTLIEIKHETLPFFAFSTPVLFTALATSAYGCCISAMFENFALSSLLSVPLDLISYALCGIFLQLSSLPDYLSWVKYISRFYYGLEAASIIQWDHLTNIPCSPNPTLPCTSTGREVLENYGYNPSSLYWDYYCLVLMFFILHFIGFSFLLKRSRNQAVY